MAGQRVIAVFGATGNQGGSVARSLAANHSSFQVRALTRNPNSDAAQSLQKIGATPTAADGWNSDQMVKALEGAWGLFLNLNSEDPIFIHGTAPGTEFDLGKIIVDAAVTAGVKHIVFSSAASCTEMTNGKFNMVTMMMKNKIEHYIRDLQKFETATFINAGWFMEFLKTKEVAPIFGGFPYFPDDEGVLTFSCPRWGGEEQAPWLSVSRDFGDMVHGIFLDPARWDGKVIHGASYLSSLDGMTNAFQQATGKKARYNPVLPNWEAWDIHGIKELEDIKALFGFLQETGGAYMGDEPINITNAAELKRKGAEARGVSGDELVCSNLQQFFTREFAMAA